MNDDLTKEDLQQALISMGVLSNGIEMERIEQIKILVEEAKCGEDVYSRQYVLGFLNESLSTPRPSDQQKYFRDLIRISMANKKWNSKPVCQEEPKNETIMTQQTLKRLTKIKENETPSKPKELIRRKPFIFRVPDPPEINGMSEMSKSIFQSSSLADKTLSERERILLREKETKAEQYRQKINDQETSIRKYSCLNDDEAVILKQKLETKNKAKMEILSKPPPFKPEITKDFEQRKIALFADVQKPKGWEETIQRLRRSRSSINRESGFVL